MRNAILLSLLATTVNAQPIGTFVPTGTMNAARSGHTATLLNDGRVLITGGAADSAPSAELFDPSTGTFIPTGSMITPRSMHTATLLPNGKVLIAGGAGTATAEIYDPSTGTFTATGSLLEDQFGQSATLLRNGQVLITGGERAAPPWPTAAHAELYDPTTGTFSFLSDYAETGTQYASGGPVWPTANLLRDGRVLIASENPPEIYDPASASFSVTGQMSNYANGMFWQSATTLRDGTVLVTGGVTDDMSCDGVPNADLYDPSSGTFTVLSPMTQSREIHTSTLLQDGTVLITGGGDGWCHSATFASAELYVPSTRSFVAAGTMSISRTAHTATLLHDGTVLITGGTQFWPASVTNTAEIYRPASVRTGRLRAQR